MILSTIDPLIAAGVVLATAATDAVYVMFTSAVVARRRVPAANWSCIWVFALVLRGDPLHRELALCRFRGRRFLDRSLRLAQFSSPTGATLAVA